MDAEERNKGHVQRTAIEGELTIFTARSVHESLLAALQDGDEVEIDLSGVNEMDSAGLQLMIAAKREAVARNKALRFIGHSPTVLDTLDLCDLSAYFGDPVLIPRG